MKHRMSRRRTAIFALISGVSGIAANLLLAGFFALARPWVETSGPLTWLGPANDVVGAISMATMIPVVLYLRRAVPPDRLLRLLSGGTVAGMAALALVAPLMLAGVVTLTVQFVVAGVTLPVIFGWLLVINRSGLRAGVLPRSTANFGRAVGAAALIGTVLAGAAAVASAGSAAQYTLFGLAAVIGLPAYLAFPVWPLLLARHMSADAEPRRGARTPRATSTGEGSWR